MNKISLIQYANSIKINLNKNNTPSLNKEYIESIINNIRKRKLA